MATIRKLTGLAERQAALALALRVFMTYEAPDYNEEGIQNFSEFVSNKEKTDGLAIYGAYLDDALVGMGATRSGGRHISLLFVESEYHNQGIGKQLVSHIRRRCPENQITVNASPYGVEIYKKMGFVPTDKELVKDGIRYTPMTCERQNHPGTVRIETQRLVLRRFELDDASAMYENWAKDPDVTKYLTWMPHETVDDSISILNEWIPMYENKEYYHWAIERKEHPDLPIGSIGAVRYDRELNQVHIGYCIGKHWWHQGITSEALLALIEFFFNRAGMNRVDSRHDPNNPNSGKVMEKCGMRLEGTFRQADLSNQGICDTKCYAILAEEYFARKTTLPQDAKLSRREIKIRAMRGVDWPDVFRIYQEGIATKKATFQQEAPSYEEWDQDHMKECRFVAIDSKNQVVGWAALTPVSTRCVYQGVAEISVYVAAEARGQGVGKALLDHLVDESHKAGIWTLQSAIISGNVESIEMHMRCGFRVIGTRERIARDLDGDWQDVVMLERRNPEVP